MKQLFYFLFLFVIAVNAQTSEKGEVTYLDFNHKPTIKEKASYYEFKESARNPCALGTVLNCQRVFQDNY